MMSLLMMALLIGPLCGAEPVEPLSKRIALTDPSGYQQLRAVHGGAGEMKFRGLLAGSALTTTFLFLHEGVILPKGGIGHHVHRQMEEMYVILEGEAEFTINGRTSRLKGPVAVPCAMGQSHALYNPTDKPIRWLNFAVSKKKGKSDAFDLTDDRVGVPIDPEPAFVFARLDRKLLRPRKRAGRDDRNGADPMVYHRRVLSRKVFCTSWSYVDHLLVRPGVSTQDRKLVDVEEVYYVIRGAGQIQVNGQQAAIKEGNAVPVRLQESYSFVNKTEKDLELLVIGIAKEKGS